MCDVNWNRNDGEWEKGWRWCNNIWNGWNLNKESVEV
jgi:hypothetical protein